jgi:cupin fold WbuC family metalloprotein
MMMGRFTLEYRFAIAMDALHLDRISLVNERGCRRDNQARSLSYYATVPIAVVDTALYDEMEQLGNSMQSNVRLCLHTDPANPLQEMVIFQSALRYFPPKRHMKAKSFAILRGALGIFWFDTTGQLLGAAALSEAGSRICRIDAGVFHADVPLTSTAIHHEVTTGPFRGAADREMAPWGPSSGDSKAMADFRAHLITAAGFPLLSEEGWLRGQ